MKTPIEKFVDDFDAEEVKESSVIPTDEQLKQRNSYYILKMWHDGGTRIAVSSRGFDLHEIVAQLEIKKLDVLSIISENLNSIKL